jgi:hypothetical protein
VPPPPCAPPPPPAAALGDDPLNILLGLGFRKLTQPPANRGVGRHIERVGDILAIDVTQHHHFQVRWRDDQRGHVGKTELNPAKRVSSNAPLALPGQWQLLDDRLVHAQHDENGDERVGGICPDCTFQSNKPICPGCDRVSQPERALTRSGATLASTFGSAQCCSTSPPPRA